MTTNLISPRARLSFPHLFIPKVNEISEDKTPKYSCTLLFDEEAQNTPEYKAMVAAIGPIAKEKWGDKIKTIKLRHPIRDGSEKEDLEGYAGCKFISVSSKQAPQLVFAYKDPATGKLKKIEDSLDLYAGCYVKASLTIYAYDKAGNRGVNFGLRNIQKLSDGDPLGGRTRADDDFDAVEGAVDEDMAMFN